VLKRKKFLFGGIIILLAVAYLAYTALPDAFAHYYKVGELVEQGSSAWGEAVRLIGMVVPGSIEEGSVGSSLRFSIIDAEGTESLPVVYRGAVPDTFNVDSEVVLDGSLNPDGTFEAKVLMATCPSKYVPEDR